ncbi:unnamed protein product [Prorocentrum cordatum]|uniref:Uncharacterized protein n=1 Tax=Prorocentrum cordatum TaxID=2364126 RepID=A0ABN9VRF4_9DINO|nr:unnamed protein product [Polarella glacialis]
MVSGETAVAKCRGRSYARPRKRSPMERGGRRCQKQSLGHRPPRTANFGEAEGRERSLSSNSRSSIRGGLEHRKTCVRRATLQRHSFRVHRKNIARSRAVCDSHRAVDEAWLKTSKASALAGGRWKNCSSCRRRLPPLTALTHQSAAQSRISRRRGGKAG